MDAVTVADRKAYVRVKKVGGIDEAEVELRPGVNVLTGRNATNRTSFLQALMAALGSEQSSLKADADAGRVELDIGDETYTRTLSRDGRGVVFGGDPYVDDATEADLFGFLLESNDARRAVARGEDLRAVVMRPIDTEAIREEIDALGSRKRELESELEQRSQLSEELTALTEERSDLQARIEDARSALDDKRAEIADADADLERTRDNQAELESRLAELRDRRTEQEEIRYRLETERRSLERLEDERRTIGTELDELAEVPADEIEDLEAELATLRERKRGVESRITQLQALIQFNEEMLAGEDIVELDFLTNDEPVSATDLTGRLLPDGTTFTCWTCGGDTSRTEVEDTLDRLRDRRRELINERGDITDDIGVATDRKAVLNEQTERRKRLERRLEQVEEDIERAEQEKASLEEERSSLEDEIERLSGEVEALRVDEYDEIIDLNVEANAIESELEQLESRLPRIEEQIRSIESELAELENVDREMEDVDDQLHEARTRITRIEDTVVDEFNDHMASILSMLRYENLERIWIERVERKVQEGRGTVDKGFFDLHVVRSTDSGRVYEDTVNHLSESERAVTGLVFALAGYLTHEVYETVPFMLLDSLEAIDADRLAALIDYLHEYVGYLVVALLPDDAAAVDDDYHYVTAI